MRLILPGCALVPAVLLLGAPWARADLSFPQPAADAGEVRSGAPLAHRFNFVNDGPDTVEITDLRASCGCLKPKLAKRTYAPGEKGSLLFEIHTLSQPAGDHTWRLRVSYRTNGTIRQAELQLRGRVVIEVAARPAALTLFTGSTAAHEITLTDLRPRPLTVVAVHTTSSHLKARVTHEGHDPAGRRLYKIGLTVTPDCPDGRHEEVVHVLTDDDAYRDLTMPVTIVKRPKQAVTAGPSTVSLLAPRGQPVPSRVVLLRPTGDEAVVVESVEADDPAIVCTWAQGPNNLATLQVTADRRRISGDMLRSAVHVHLSKPVRETLTIPVTCRLE